MSQNQGGSIEKTVGDYLTFEFSMIMQGRKYLFDAIFYLVDNKNDNDVSVQIWSIDTYQCITTILEKGITHIKDPLKKELILTLQDPKKNTLH